MADVKADSILHPALLDPALLYITACNGGRIPWSRYGTAMNATSSMKKVVEDIIANADVMQSFVAGHIDTIFTWEGPSEVYAFYTLAEVLANHLCEIDIEPVKLPSHVTSYLESVRCCLPQFPHYYVANSGRQKPLKGKKDTETAMSYLFYLCAQGMCDWSMHCAFLKTETCDMHSMAIPYIKDSILKEPVFNVIIGSVKKGKIQSIVHKILTVLSDDYLHRLTLMTRQKCTAVAMTLFPSSKLLVK